jgi:hypothetical protein
MRGVERSAGSIRVSRSVLRKLDLSRDQSQRGLRALAAAGLIRFVVSGRGHCPVVELVTIEHQHQRESDETGGHRGYRVLE